MSFNIVLYVLTLLIGVSGILARLQIPPIKP